MTPRMLDLVRTWVWECDIKSPILEIGSYIEDNQELLNLRRAFPRGTPYLGVDVIGDPSRGVDAQCDLLDMEQVQSLATNYAPQATLCLYVIEHVWDIRRAVQALASIWMRHPESWLWVATHQNQPYHGTLKYPDYWRITASGMKRLMEHVGISGGHVVVSPDSSNPTDVIGIRQPASLPWPEEQFASVLKAAHLAHWEQYC